MVVSLSSDRAVWDAVMNNEVVRELRESFYAGWYELSYSVRKEALTYNASFQCLFPGFSRLVSL